MKNEEFTKVAEEIQRSAGLPYSFQGGAFEAFKLGIHAAITVMQRHVDKPAKEIPEQEESR